MLLQYNINFFLQLQIESELNLNNVVGTLSSFRVEVIHCFMFFLSFYINFNTPNLKIYTPPLTQYIMNIEKNKCNVFTQNISEYFFVSS